MNILYDQFLVVTEMFALYDPMVALEGLRCALTVHGVPFAATLGIILMLQLLVGRLDIHLMVR